MGPVPDASIRRLVRRRLPAAAAILLAAAPVSAQPPLTLEDIYHPQRRIDFSGSVPSGLEWIDDGRYLEPRNEAGGVVWTVVNAEDSSTRPLFEPARMREALAAIPGTSAGDAERAAWSRSLSFDAGFRRALVTLGPDLYLYEFDADRAARLTQDAEEELVALLSPDGEWVAFVRDNDLHVVNTRTGAERALTTDGGAKILNGVLDWVYEEEIYGRGQRRGFWWSPDSSRVAFLRTDDTPVPDYVLLDDIPYRQTIERWSYPQAGDPNPIVTLGIASVDGLVQWVDLSRYPDDDRLVTGVMWTPDGRLVYQIQNRIQSWLDLRVVDAEAGTARLLLRETSERWVNNRPLEGVRWLRDGSFLRVGEDTGWAHVYHHEADGTLVRAVTQGEWDVRTLHGVDEDEGWVYFSGTERSSLGLDVYRVRLDGTRLTRLSETSGTHRARFSQRFTYYIDTWSDLTTPSQVRLYWSNGGEARVIADNRVETLQRFRLAAPTLLRVPARDGVLLDAMLIRPPDFDPSRRYPVYQFTYGGPQTPTVRNAWGGAQYMYHQLLAQKGIVVWICDNRTASARGVQSAWPVYRNFGELELRDIEDCLAWLKRQPWVDAERIGLHGWSFGGYMTSYALTHSRSFAMGIAGGTVSDWRSYDTIYTERYMGLPSENEDGYRRSAPRWSAANLHGALLLIHGAIDENVHPAHTMQFAYELQKAGKPFELMLYPKSRHGISDPQLVWHMRSMMLAFTERHLLGGAARQTPSSSARTETGRADP